MDTVYLSRALLGDSTKRQLVEGGEGWCGEGTAGSASGDLS
jgi:hypothetical protein